MYNYRHNVCVEDLQVAGAALVNMIKTGKELEIQDQDLNTFFPGKDEHSEIVAVDDEYVVISWHGHKVMMKHMELFTIWDGMSRQQRRAQVSKVMEQKVEVNVGGQTFMQGVGNSRARQQTQKKVNVVTNDNKLLKKYLHGNL